MSRIDILFSLIQLHKQDYDTKEAFVELVRKPIVGRLHRKKNWSKEHSVSCMLFKQNSY